MEPECKEIEVRGFQEIIFFSKIAGRRNCFSYREKLLKFEVDGQEFAKSFVSLRQFILEPACCKKRQKIVPGFWTSEGPEGFQTDSK